MPRMLAPPEGLAGRSGFEFIHARHHYGSPFNQAHRLKARFLEGSWAFGAHPRTVGAERGRSADAARLVQWDIAIAATVPCPSDALRTEDRPRSGRSADASRP